MNTNDSFLPTGLILIVVSAITVYFRNIPEKLWEIFERCFIIRLDIQQEDESFHWLKLWLSKRLETTLSIAVMTKRKRGLAGSDYLSIENTYKYEVVEGGDNRPRIIFVPAVGVYWFNYRGIPVIVSASRTEAMQQSDSGYGSVSKPRETFSVRMLTRNREMAKRMIEDARDCALPQDGKVEVRVPNQQYWNLTSRLRPRKLDSVVLDKNYGEEILKDLKDFLAGDEWYSRLGIPYRRTYLFHGPPGGGKSSLAIALASSLKMNLHLLNLASATMNDNVLCELLSTISLNSIVLIEDVDCAFVKRDGKKNFGLTFSGLLNALDGIASQDGRIVFMTTNHMEKLDPALIRPGRVDYKVYIDNATKDQIARLFVRFYDCHRDVANKFVKDIPERKLSMASVQGYLQQYKDDYSLALRNVDNLIKEIK